MPPSSRGFSARVSHQRSIPFVISTTSFHPRWVHRSCLRRSKCTELTSLQDREGEWEDIVVETPRQLAHIKRDLCAIAFGLYILSREKTADTAGIFAASANSRPAGLSYPSLRDFSQERCATGADL
jgi:hypothetical protein